RRGADGLLPVWRCARQFFRRPEGPRPGCVRVLHGQEGHHQPMVLEVTSEEIIALSKRHTIFEWSAQGVVDPIPVARASGVYFYTPDGKRYLDFNSQLMCVNIGHGDARVVKALEA